MADPEWGKKRTCLSCGALFYDLKKKNIECPKCGAAFSLDPPAKPKRPPPPADKPKPEDTSQIEPAEEKADDAVLKPKDDGPDKSPAKKKKKNDGDEDGNGDGDEAKADEKDDALIVDASDLGEDDDDMSEVKEHIDDGVEDKN